MSSEVDIANLALSHLGDTATVASLDPPEGSAQAEHCARFYPIARDSLLQAYNWGFASKRATMANLASGWSQWDFAYVKPSDALSIRAVVAPDSTNEDAESLQPFVLEVDANDNDVIYSDQEFAVVLYTRRVVDTAKYSPMFVMALSWHLASMLAGPLIKGDAGAAMAQRCAQQMGAWLSKAIESDANQRRIAPAHTVSWMAAR
jgi:hypothetical protein